MVSRLDLYKIFFMVSKVKSFSKAASELYMTQPAVSMAIMQLEKELDVRLFTRIPKGVVLTNEGKLLEEYISSAMNLIDSGERKLSECRNLISGELKIGAGDTNSKYFLLPYLEMFHNKFPNINLKIINRTTFELCRLLKTGEIDIALCNLPIEDSHIEVKKCIDIQDIFVCGKKYEILKNRKIKLEELIEHDLILLEDNSNSRMYVDDFFQKNGIKLKSGIELGSHDLILEFAKINLGIACVIKEFSQKYINEGFLYEVDLEKAIPKRALGLCYWKNVSLSSAAKMFMDIVLNEKMQFI